EGDRKHGDEVKCKIVWIVKQSTNRSFDANSRQRKYSGAIVVYGIDTEDAGRDEYENPQCLHSLLRPHHVYHDDEDQNDFEKLDEAIPCFSGFEREWNRKKTCQQQQNSEIHFPGAGCKPVFKTQL